MEKCTECNTWLTSCPCCNESFCPNCFTTESEMEEYEEEN